MKKHTLARSARSTELPSNVRAKIEDGPGGCWIWTGSRDGKGYGKLGGSTNGKLWWAQAHRFVFHILVGPVPEDKELHHRCEVRHCVNPEHIEVVTSREHGRYSRQVRKTHCPQGHPLSGANLYEWTDGKGRVQRHCRTCRRNRQRATEVQE